MKLSSKHLYNRESLQDVKVLQYYGIRTAEYEDPFFLGVDEITFRRQMQWIDTMGYTSITFEDYKMYLNREFEYLPKKPIIITFDDVNESVYKIAFPILQSYGMKAVLFILGDMSIPTNIWDENIGKVAPLINEQQVLEMRYAGFEIGSLSLQHRKLTEISEAEAWEEIFKSRTSLEILLNEKVQTFAFPFGLVNPAIKKMVLDAGYSFGCASYSGSPKLAFDLFEIRRIKLINSSNPLVIIFQLQTIYGFYRWIEWKIKKYLLSM